MAAGPGVTGGSVWPVPGPADMIGVEPAAASGLIPGAVPALCEDEDGAAVEVASAPQAATSTTTTSSTVVARTIRAPSSPRAGG